MRINLREPAIRHSLAQSPQIKEAEGIVRVSTSITGIFVSTIYIPEERYEAGLRDKFETVVFGGAFDGQKVISETIEEALAAHQKLWKTIADTNRREKYIVRGLMIAIGVLGFVLAIT